MLSPKRRCMYLRMYLSKKKISITDFAKELGKSRAHIQGICTGRYRASKNLAMKIVQATNNEVMVCDLEQACDEFERLNGE